LMRSMRSPGENRFSGIGWEKQKDQA